MGEIIDKAEVERLLKELEENKEFLNDYDYKNFKSIYENMLEEIAEGEK